MFCVELTLVQIVFNVTKLKQKGLECGVLAL